MEGGDIWDVEEMELEVEEVVMEMEGNPIGIQKKVDMVLVDLDGGAVMLDMVVMEFA